MLGITDEPMFWQCKSTQEFQATGGITVKYDAKLIRPPPPHGKEVDSRLKLLPMLVYFGGFGWEGGLENFEHWLDNSAWGQLPLEYVLVAPLRPAESWWFLESGTDWGWVDGAFKVEVVDAFLHWLLHLTQDQSIDKLWVSLLGFSAGAYAVLELIARNSRLHFRGVVVGGVHGHGQPDMLNLTGEHAQHESDVLGKWRDFLERLHGLTLPPTVLLAVHNKSDRSCPWKHAELLYTSLKRTCSRLERKDLDLPRMEYNLSGHDYWDRTFVLTHLLRLLPEADPCEADEGNGGTEMLEGTPKRHRNEDKRLPVHGRSGETGTPRSILQCSSLSCCFLVHPDRSFGGFCCKKCHACFVKKKRDAAHGKKCLGVRAPEGSQIAECQPPDFPLIIE
jgi:hypothetical protein